MRTILMAALLAAAPMAAHADEAETEAALTGLADTFARGFYARDASMVLSTVHPELSKIGVIENYRGSGEDIIEQLPPGTLRVLGHAYNYDNRFDPETSTVDVNFYDTTEHVGVFQLLAAQEWYDFFLGTQINGEWVLVNCAYAGQNQLNNPDRDADMAVVATVVSRYAAAWDTGDYEQLLGTVYPDADRRHVVRGEGREYLQPETLETIAIDLETRAPASQASTVTVFDATRRTAAARIDADDRTEWVLLQRLDDRWQIVNAFWEAAG